MARQSHFASSARGFSCFCFISGHRIFVTTPHYFDLSSYPEMLKSNFFCAKNFNIFYDFSREKNPTSAIRSPIKPRKFPIKPRKFPIKHLENPRCFVLHPLYWAKKAEKVPCLGLSPLRSYKDNTFFREIQIALTYRNTLEMLKTRGFMGLCPLVSTVALLPRFRRDFVPYFPYLELI